MYNTNSNEKQTPNCTQPTHQTYIKHEKPTNSEFKKAKPARAQTVNRSKTQSDTWAKKILQ